MKPCISILAAIGSGLVLAACSQQSVYENIQQDMQRRCEKLPPSEFQACMEQTRKPYEEYHRERDEALTHSQAAAE